MASAAQIEAFAWWLGQDRDNRRASVLEAQFNLPRDTATKWVTAYNKELSKVAHDAAQVHLRQYRAEYEQAQSRTVGILPDLIDGIETNARTIKEMAKNGQLVNPDLIGKTASALKTVYSLAEAASGADIAKRRALQPGSDGAGGAPRLPDLSGLFAAAAPAVGEVVEPAETVSNNDPGNENRSDSGGSEEI